MPRRKNFLTATSTDPADTITDRFRRRGAGEARESREGTRMFAGEEPRTDSTLAGRVVSGIPSDLA
jgi:hypothetical protein